MSSKVKIGLIIAATIVVQVIGAGLFIESGMYDIGADDHHTKTVLALIERLRERSIGVRVRPTNMPALDDSKRIAVGAERYSALCVGCHLAPGVSKSAIRAGLYPHPPSLSQEEVQDSQRAFWIIKHGIKMSAMPAWGKSMDDTAIWDIVAFVRAMPDMTPEAYQQLSQ